MKIVIPEGIVSFKILYVCTCQKTGEWLHIKSYPGVMWRLAYQSREKIRKKAAEITTFILHKRSSQIAHK